jgi:uncharacterized protein YndB with AHSA1/START domain
MPNWPARQLILSVRSPIFGRKTLVTNTFAKLSSIGALLVLTAYYSQQEQLASDDFRRDGMTSVVNTVTITGAPEAVFDLITTARFWPQWHPASMAVGGVTERPYGLDDRIHERGRIRDQDFQITWQVVEHVRPSRVVLQSGRSPARITYSFQGRDGATVFTRKLEYKMENFTAVAATPDEVDRLMRVQSEQAVNELKALVEKILREEAIGIQ